MKISVIIPYHGEDIYIKDCLESLAEQTYKDFEIIIVTSGTNVALDGIDTEYDLDIKVLSVKEENVAKARNVGIKNAKGKYVMFLDCDDYLKEDFFEKMMAVENDDSYDLLYGKIVFSWYKRMFFNQKGNYSDMEESDEKNADDVTDTYDATGESEEEINNKRYSTAQWNLVSKRKNYSGITALGTLYLRSMLEENNIYFDEELIYYCDIPFVAAVLCKSKIVNGDKRAIYIKRRHNDPIHMPSLLQKIGKEEFNYFINSYDGMIKNTEADTELRWRFERKLITYFSSTVAPAIAKNEDRIWREKNSSKIKEYILDISPKVYKELSRYKRKLVDAIKNDDYKKIEKLTKKHNIVNILKHTLKRGNFKRTIKELVYTHVYLKRPIVNNLVLLESFLGKNYSDSPKYIYEKLNEMYPGKYQYIWIIDKKVKLPYPAKQVKRFSFAYYKYLATARYIVFNSRQPTSFVKRKGNIFLQTWHGTPLKKLVFDMDDVLSAAPTYKKDFYYQSRAWDYLIAANGFSDEVFKRAFEFNKHMLKFGYPRNDILHAADKDEIAAKIKRNMGIPADKKVVLYAPTWRDDEYYGKGKYKFTLQLDLNKMKKELGDEYVVILRTHYFIADSIDVSGVEDFVYNLSKYDDIAELYLISDILITDYSSVFFDYANLKRPMLFYTYDIDKYRDVLRGFYIDMEKEIPGPLLYNTDEVIDSIKNIDEVQKKYSGTYEEFYERFCGWEDGNASENCIKEVFK